MIRYLINLLLGRTVATVQPTRARYARATAGDRDRDAYMWCNKARAHDD